MLCSTFSILLCVCVLRFIIGGLPNLFVYMCVFVFMYLCLCLVVSKEYVSWVFLDIVFSVFFCFFVILFICIWTCEGYLVYM